MNAKRLILLLALLASWPAGGQDFGFGGYEVVSSTRVGRTQFEYVLRVRLTNNIANAEGLSAQVFSLSANTEVVEGEVDFGNVNLAANGLSVDTFTIRQDRLFPFDPSQLMWFPMAQRMPLEVSVTQPTSGYLTNGTQVILNGIVGAGVEGVKVQTTTSASLNGNNYQAVVNLEEGRNTVTVLATNQYGGLGTASVVINRDTVAPIVSVQEPAAGTVTASRQITVSGLVNDAVPGTVNPEQASVMVNGVAGTVLNRTYTINEVLLVPGSNTIQVVARDRAGNERRTQIGVLYQDPARQKHLNLLGGEGQSGQIGNLLPEPLLVELVDGDNVPQTNQPVTFTVTRNDGVVIATPDSGRTLNLLTDDKGRAQVLYQLGSRTGVGNNQVAASSPGVLGDVLFNATATGAPPAKVSALIPETQVGQAGQALPLPWSAFVTDAGGNPVADVPITFSVYQGGGSFYGASSVSTNTDGDGRASAFLTLGPDAGVNNNVALASVSSVTNSSAVFTASALVARQAGDTRILGLVLDEANRPMTNILCTIPGTSVAGVSDIQGQFILTGVPVGAVRLFVDGRNRGYPGQWHYLQFDLVTVAGQDNTLDRPIYMLRMDEANAKLAGGNDTVILELKGIPGSSLTIFPHSIRTPGGQPITNLVSWTQVNAQRVPMAPPGGSQFGLAWSVQPADLRFSPPARVCIPNNMGQPGQVFEMFGFDHDLAAFVSLGTGTVSPDGSQICSDPGFGIVKSGWGGAAPPPPPCTPVCGPAPMDTDCVKYETIPPASNCDCPTYRSKQTKITKVEAKANGKDEAFVCIGETVNFSTLVESENCSGYQFEWKFDDGLIFDTTSTAQNPTFAYQKSGVFNPNVKVTCSSCPSATKSDSVRVTVVEVDSLTVASATEFDDGDGDDKTKSYVAFKGSGSLTVIARPKPSVAESDLPAGWTLTGGTGSGKLQRTVSLAASGTFDIEAKCNTSSRKAKIYVVEVELVTPKGDPVAAPVDSGAGQNEFTFSTDTFFADLQIDFEASVKPAGIPAAGMEKVKEKVFFTIENVGTSPSWHGDNPGGRASVSGTKLIAHTEFNGLPSSNSAFGKKKVELKADGTVVETVTIETFFPRDAKNNPGGVFSSDPNWFYYWMEGGVCGIPADAEYDASADFGYTRPGTDTFLRLGPLAPQANTGPETYTHKGTGIAITVTGVGKGIKCVAETVVHEVHHVDIYNATGGATDTDGDGVGDTLEPTLDGLNTLVADADTYNMAGFSSGYASYGDNEVRCRKLELSPPAYFPAKDWANPGCQSKNKNGP